MVSDLSRALAETGADFAYADMHVVDDAGRILRRFALPDYTFEAAFCRWYLCGICKLYKRELHDRFGGYDPDWVSQDHELYLRFAMGGARFTHVAKVLAHVRIHESDRKRDNHTREKESRQSPIPSPGCGWPGGTWPAWPLVPGRAARGPEAPPLQDASVPSLRA
jgi:hypothetical protein